MSYVIPKKEYEKAESGMYNAVLADVVDLGMITTTFQGQAKTYPAVRLIWILNVLGKNGKPLEWYSPKYNASLHEKATLYKVLKQIIGTAPAANLDIETLIGQTRKLVINRERSADGTKDYANLMGILPPEPGVNIPIPQDFVRVKFRTQTQAGPAGQPVQTYAQPPQQPQLQAQPYAPPAQQGYPVASQPPPFAPPPQYPQPVQQYSPAPPPQGADIKF
jgi:hypothetical protein